MFLFFILFYLRSSSLFTLLPITSPSFYFSSFLLFLLLYSFTLILSSTYSFPLFLFHPPSLALLFFPLSLHPCFILLYLPSPFSLHDLYHISIILFTPPYPPPSHFLFFSLLFLFFLVILLLPSFPLPSLFLFLSPLPSLLFLSPCFPLLLILLPSSLYFLRSLHFSKFSSSSSIPSVSLSLCL